jgi:hypothetical protein
MGSMSCFNVHSKLLGMKLSERKEVLEKSGLCLFCLKHAAKLECYGQGGLSKPSVDGPAVMGSTPLAYTS